MADYKKLLPTISGETRPYWEGCKRGELLIQRCKANQHYQFYPRGICATCYTTQVDWVKASGRGVVWTYTIDYRNQAPGYRDEVPFVVALVELEEGVKMFTNIVDCKPETVRVGMPVEVVFRKATEEITIPYFRPSAGS